MLVATSSAWYVPLLTENIPRSAPKHQEAIPRVDAIGVVLSLGASPVVKDVTRGNWRLHVMCCDRVVRFVYSEIQLFPVSLYLGRERDYLLKSCVCENTPRPDCFHLPRPCECRNVVSQ